MEMEYTDRDVAEMAISACCGLKSDKHYRAAWWFVLLFLVALLALCLTLSPILSLSSHWGYHLVVLAIFFYALFIWGKRYNAFFEHWFKQSSYDGAEVLIDDLEKIIKGASSDEKARLIFLCQSVHNKNRLATQSVLDLLKEDAPHIAASPSLIFIKQTFN